MIHRLCAAIAVLFLVACSQAEHKSVTPPKEIGASFKLQHAPKSNGDLAVDKYLVGIRRDALEKEFLLRSQFISQTLAPSFQGLRSRIIAFREHGDELLMLEATQGHVIDKNTPATLLLAKFKILKEVDGVLYFDFNQGFANLYMVGDWYGSDFDFGTMYDANALFQSAPLNMSYIEDATFDSRNQLVITQVGQLASSSPPQSKVSVNVPLKTKFYLTTYQPDSGFQKYATNGDFTQFGYFEVLPMIGASSYSEVYASKFNTLKPIEYAISANTPADFKEAVREGILYWNKAFGREVLKVVEAPDGVSAPDSNLNIIQWINWDWAGGAYADAQMDPRTGQILNAQVFMTSAFAVSGKDRARAIVRQLATQKGSSGTRFGLQGFAGSALCNRTHETDFANTLSRMIANPKITDQDVLRAAQDYVREVVAHEVGHTLGLRHNFAGSTYGKFKPSDRAQVEADYFSGKVDPEIVTTSSVMDYEDFTDAFITGHHIAHAPNAMKYDEMAIRHLYDGVPYSLKETPLFCTDSLLTKAIDCMVWDSGSSAVESLKVQSAEVISQLPERLMQIFINAKSPVPGRPQIAVERVVLNAEALAKMIVQSRMGLLKLLEKQSRLLAIERQFDAVDTSDNARVIAAKMDYVKKELDRFGGLKGAINRLDQSTLQGLIDHVDIMINSGNYDKGLDPTETPYQFTSTELSVIRERSKQTIARVIELMPELEIKALGEWTEELADHPLAEEYAELLKSRADEWLFATTGQALTGKATLKDGTVIDVNAPVFKYSHKIRKGVAELLNREGKPSTDWGYVQLTALKEQYKKTLNSAFSEKWDEVKTDGFSRELIKWYLENKEILDGLDRDQGPSSKAQANKSKPKKS